MTSIFWVSFGLLWFLVIIQGLAFLEMLRQIGQLRKQVGPQQGALIMQGAVNAGDPLPQLVGLSAHNLHPARWEDYLDPHFSIVVLLSTHCITCRTIAEDLTRLAGDVSDEVGIMVFVEGKIDEAQAFIAKTRLNPRLVVIDEQGETAKELNVLWNPAAVTIRGKKLGEALIINDSHQLNALVRAKEVDYAISR